MILTPGFCLWKTFGLTSCMCVCVSTCQYHCFLWFLCILSVCATFSKHFWVERFGLFASVQTCMKLAVAWIAQKAPRHTHPIIFILIIYTYLQFNSMKLCILHRCVTQLQFRVQSCVKGQNYVHMCTLEDTNNDTQIQKSIKFYQQWYSAKMSHWPKIDIHLNWRTKYFCLYNPVPPLIKSSYHILPDVLMVNKSFTHDLKVS